MRRALRMAWSHLPLGTFRALGLAAVLAGAAGCGQTGPLTLPGPATSPSTSAAPPADADEAEDDESRSDER